MVFQIERNKLSTEPISEIMTQMEMVLRMAGKSRMVLIHSTVGNQTLKKSLTKMRTTKKPANRMKLSQTLTMGRLELLIVMVLPTNRKLKSELTQRLVTVMVMGSTIDGNPFTLRQFRLHKVQLLS